MTRDETARIMRDALTPWEQNLLRVSGKDFGYVRREFGGLRSRPAEDQHYGEIKYEDHLETILAAIGVKAEAAIARARLGEQARGDAAEQPAPASALEEGPMDRSTIDDHIVPWLREHTRFTKPELRDAFGFAPATVHRLMNDLLRWELVVETDDRQRGPGGGRAAVVFRYTPPVEVRPEDAPGFVRSPTERLIDEPLRTPELEAPADDAPSLAEMADAEAPELEPVEADDVTWTTATGAGAVPATVEALEAAGWVADAPPLEASNEAEESEPPVSATDLDELNARITEQADRLAELAGNVGTLDACRKQMAEALREVRADLATERAAREDLVEQLGEARAMIADCRVETAHTAQGIGALGDRITGYASDVTEARALVTDAVHEVRTELEALGDRFAVLEATWDASSMEALDVTLGAAVAGLVAIGRGDLDPRRLVEHLREEAE